MNSTCACATLAQKMEALKEKHRYFMQFSLKDDCILFFSPASFRSFARAIAIWWLRCHHCFCFLASLFFVYTVICLQFTVELFVLSSRHKLPFDWSVKNVERLRYAIFSFAHLLCARKIKYTIRCSPIRKMLTGNRMK